MRADPGQLEQVIVNLVVNARDAVLAKGEGGGKIMLATRKVSLKNAEGQTLDLIAGEEVTNLPQLKVGDVVDVVRVDLPEGAVL